MEIGVHEAIQVAVEHPLDVPDLDVGAQVLDHLIGLQHI